jgi:muramoyltetrapeptide carboxypeptidase
VPLPVVACAGSLALATRAVDVKSCVKLTARPLVSDHAAVIYPDALTPRARVRVIAPSGPFDRTLFFRALGWLGQRYRVEWSPNILEREGYLAGNDQRRLDELSAALEDPSLGAIVAVRGGYGAGRVSHRVAFESLRSAPKWLVGFSDFTVLHLEAARVGVCSLHAANLSALGRADANARSAWLDALERPRIARSWTGLTALHPGDAEGRLAGGNLCLLASQALSGRLRLPWPCLLFIEEVNEAPYRIDRMLTALVLGGHLDAVRGVCVGHLTDCGRSDASPSALEVIAERLRPLGVPLVAGLPVGHGQPNQPLLLGAMAKLTSTPPSLQLLPA